MCVREGDDVGGEPRERAVDVACNCDHGDGDGDRARRCGETHGDTRGEVWSRTDGWWMRGSDRWCGVEGASHILLCHRDAVVVCPLQHPRVFAFPLVRRSSRRQVGDPF
jgi:hypothetical protein